MESLKVTGLKSKLEIIEKVSNLYNRTLEIPHLNNSKWKGWRKELEILRELKRDSIIKIAREKDFFKYDFLKLSNTMVTLGMSKFKFLKTYNEKSGKNQCNQT